MHASSIFRRPRHATSAKVLVATTLSQDKAAESICAVSLKVYRIGRPSRKLIRHTDAWSR